MSDMVPRRCHMCGRSETLGGFSHDVHVNVGLTYFTVDLCPDHDEFEVQAWLADSEGLWTTERVWWPDTACRWCGHPYCDCERDEQRLRLGETA